jgi:hypothetical protein
MELIYKEIHTNYLQCIKLKSIAEKQQSVLLRINTTSICNYNTLILATFFGFYQPSSGLCLPVYRGTFSVHIHYGIQ